MHHLKTRSTGTVHATIDGKPLCPIPAATATDATDEAVTCRRCLATTVVEVVDEHQDDTGLTTEPYTRDEVRIAYLRGVIQGANEPNLTLTELKAAALVAIGDIRDKQCDHQPATDPALEIAVRVGALAVGQVCHELGIADVREMSAREAEGLLTEEERFAVVAEIRRLLAKRRAPTLRLAITAKTHDGPRPVLAHRPGALNPNLTTQEEEPMPDPIQPSAIRRCTTVPWCRNIPPHDDASHTVHTRDLDTVDAANGDDDVVGVIAVQAGALGDPVIRVMYGPAIYPSWVDLPISAARALGQVVDSLTITSYAEFAAALTRGADMFDEAVNS